MRNKIKRLFSKKYLAILLIVITAVVLYILLQNFKQVREVFSRIFGYLSPVITGLAIAYLINPLVNLLSKKCFKKIKRRRLAHVLAVVISLVLIIALFITLVSIIIPEVSQSVMTLVSNMDIYMNTFKEFVTSISEKFEFDNFDVDQMIGNWDNMIGNIVEWITANINNIINASVNIGSKIIETLISFIIAIYVLLDRDNILNYTKRVFKAFMRPTSYDKLGTKMSYIHGIFIKYIIGEIVDASIVFMANYIFMALFNMPYQLLISVTVAITNLIPTFGPFIGAVPSVLLILIINPMDAVIFVIWTIGLQFVDGYVIKPLILGDTLGLSPLLVLVSVIVGGKMFGIIGMLLAMPVATTLVYIFNEQLEKREEKVKRAALAEGAHEDGTDDATEGSGDLESNTGKSDDDNEDGYLEHANEESGEEN